METTSERLSSVLQCFDALCYDCVAFSLLSAFFSFLRVRYDRDATELRVVFRLNYDRVAFELRVNSV